jgi:hypothetical protein
MPRKTLALLAFLLAALLVVPAAARSPATPTQPAGWTNWADAPPPGFALGGGSLAVQTGGTVEDDSGDEIPGLTVEKVACRNISTQSGNGFIVAMGACILRYSDGLNRGKFRWTIFDHLGNPSSGNIGLDQSPPHFRRLYAYPNGVKTLVAGTLQRGACLGCHSAVGYSNRACVYPVRVAFRAESEDLYIRLGGVLYGPDFVNWSNSAVGCGS